MSVANANSKTNKNSNNLIIAGNYKFIREINIVRLQTYLFDK